MYSGQFAVYSGRGRIPPSTKVLLSDIMGLKPISMEMFLKPGFCPPVTGYDGRSRPVANRYDTSRTFPRRDRSSSLRRTRTEEEIELSRMYDLSARYPPHVVPDRPATDVNSIKELLVAAVAMGEELKPKFAVAPEEWKLMGKFNFAILELVEAIVEKGIVPIDSDQDNMHRVANKSMAAVSAMQNCTPPQQEEGEDLLREALKRADTESVLFDANLGPQSVMNKKTLLPAFTAGLKASAEEVARKNEKELGEHLRVASDALDCVGEVEFLGEKSKLYENRRDKNDPKNGTFCTMPIKLTFEDRQDRINFERTVKSHCGLRAVMSLPKKVRTEQTAFGNALRERYPGMLVMVRVDTRKLLFKGYMKKDGENKWKECKEVYDIPKGILLQGYKAKEKMTLPPACRVEEGESMDD